MPEFEFTVIETRTYDVRYVVEADTPEEALEMAESGETVEETKIKCRDVLNRTIYSGPREVQDA
jgi:hypothetical protein